MKHKGTRMAKDEEELTRITNDEFEKMMLNFSIRQTVS